MSASTSASLRATCGAATLVPLKATIQPTRGSRREHARKRATILRDHGEIGTLPGFCLPARRVVGGLDLFAIHRRADQDHPVCFAIIGCPDAIADGGERTQRCNGALGVEDIVVTGFAVALVGLRMVE